jgi:hypothetical protein
MATYRTILLVDSKELATLLTLIEESEHIKLASVTDFGEPEPLPYSRPAPVRAEIETSQPQKASVSKGNRQGISGLALVTSTLESGPADLNELKRVFKHRGFSPNSASTYVSRMLRDGVIVRGVHGRFALKAATTNGASPHS